LGEGGGQALTGWVRTLDAAGLCGIKPDDQKRTPAQGKNRRQGPKMGLVQQFFRGQIPVLIMKMAKKREIRGLITPLREKRVDYFSGYIFMFNAP